MAKDVQNAEDVVLEKEYERQVIAVAVKDTIVKAIEAHNFRGRVTRQKVVDIIIQTVV